MSAWLQVYQAALDIRIAVFGGNNLQLANAHEDLAYSTYVQEYSSGNFQGAKSVANSFMHSLTAQICSRKSCDVHVHVIRMRLHYAARSVPSMMCV